MTKKSAGRVKHIPQRTCIGCREVLPKRQMFRIVRTTNGVRVDPSGKLAGRGAYLHDRLSCWTRGLKGALAHALKTSLSKEDLAHLNEVMITLPKEAETDG